MFKEKLKALALKNQEGDSKKKIENLVVFIVIVIITIIAINYILGNKKETASQNKTTSTYKELASIQSSAEQKTEDKNELEQKLENILSKMDGVGKVDVLITYSQSSEVVAMYNEKAKSSNTKEADAQGGQRDVEESDITKEVIYKEENGVNVPVTQTVINPKIEGALITAQGANSSSIKENIIQAVEAVTGLATHKIQVFQMN